MCLTAENAGRLVTNRVIPGRLGASRAILLLERRNDNMNMDIILTGS